MPAAQSASLGTTYAAANPRQNQEDKILLVLTLIIGATVWLVVAFIFLTENLGAALSSRRRSVEAHSNSGGGCAGHGVHTRFH